ncbi:MAG: FGGY family carbohydrate kinase [Anaerolineae bacterium]|nr:FGGY family carbohydrate kinase [Anaerolineae bacterium]
MGDAILGLDIGTTSTKAVLYDLSGAELATAEQSYRLRTPQPGWVEQDPEALWQALLGVLRTVTGRAGDLAQVRAMALAAQSGSLLPARRDGTPVSPIITWLDGRSAGLVERWKAQGLEAKVRAISGWHLYPGLCLPAIAWLRQYQPQAFAAARRFLSANDFLVQRLTGRFCTNPSNGGGMQLLDVATGAWSEELCALAGIEPGQLSPILPSGTVVGPVTPEVSRLTGLASETVVVNGGHDQGCTALGLAVTSPGKVLLGCGTAWVITGVTGTPDVALLPPSLDLNFLPVPPRGPGSQRWTASQSLGGLGASLEWLLQRCWPGAGAESRASAFAALDAELAQTRPGGNGLFALPLTGGHSAPAGDQRGALWGLRLDHSRADMARAIMEGAAYELRWALEPIRQAGMPVEQMWMVGGAASSPLWPTIVADVTGVPLSLPQGSHWPAVGAAILAGLGTGAFETMAAGQARFQQPARQIEPDQARMSLYDQWFAAYLALSGSVTRVVRTEMDRNRQVTDLA